MSNSFLRNSFNINKIEVTLTPQFHAVNNQFDEFGLLLNQPRLPGETNLDYKERLYDLFIHRSNSTYAGLIFGMTRDAGLDLFSPIRIYPKKSSGNIIAPNPVVVFNGPQVILYSDWSTKTVELSFDRYEQSGVAYFIENLVSYINANSIYFGADLLDAGKAKVRSMTIMNSKNTEVVREIVPISKRFSLTKPGFDAGKIIVETIKVNYSNAFQKKVSTFNNVIASGDYFIDAQLGHVNLFTLPGINTVIVYDYIVSDWQPLCSDIIIHSTENPYFSKKLFEQITDSNNNIINGLSTEFGSDIFNELISVYPLYFGK
jgi:hypothetical protein